MLAINYYDYYQAFETKVENCLSDVTLLHVASCDPYSENPDATTNTKTLSHHALAKKRLAHLILVHQFLQMPGASAKVS